MAPNRPPFNWGLLFSLLFGCVVVALIFSQIQLYGPKPGWVFFAAIAVVALALSLYRFLAQFKKWR